MNVDHASLRTRVHSALFAPLFLAAFLGYSGEVDPPFLAVGPYAVFLAVAATIVLLQAEMRGARFWVRGTAFLPLLVLDALPDSAPFRGACLIAAYLPAANLPGLSLQLRGRLRQLLAASTVALAAFGVFAIPAVHRELVLGLRWASAAPRLESAPTGELGPEQWLWSPFVVVALTILSDLRFARTRASVIPIALGALLAVGGALAFRSTLVSTCGLAVLTFAWAIRRVGQPAAASREVVTYPRMTPSVAASAVAVLASVVLSLGAGGPSAAERDLSRPKIGFLQSNLMNLEPPPSDWGMGSTKPAFGVWRQLLEESGYETVVVERPLDPDDLATLSVLVLINDNGEGDAQELALVHDFVERGGGLLLLADHTNIDGQLEPTNALLEPYGIRLLFDCAIPTDPGWDWQGCVRALPHPITRGVGAGGMYRFAIGASLEVEAPGVPILQGRRAFSDAGDADNARRSYLGNMAHDPEERLGGVTLIAGATAGAGRVLVFGDTSSFQDASVSVAFPFLSNVMEYLVGTSSSEPLPAWPLWAAGLALLAIRPRPSRPLAGTLLGWTLALGAPLVMALDRAAPPSVVYPSPDRLVWLDLTHGSTAKTRSGEELEMDGFEKAFARFGWLALQVEPDLETSLEQGGAIAVLQSSRGNYSASELDAIERFLRGGGVVWLMGGRYERLASPALFERFAIEVPHLPLGGAPEAHLANSEEPVDLRECWPVELEASEPLVTAWDYPIVVSKSIGDGELIVVGDPEVFLGSGLEKRWVMNKKNTALFELLLEPANERISR